MIPEVVRKAFKVAQTEKPGASFIELPENVAEADVEGKAPLRVQAPTAPFPPRRREGFEQAAERALRGAKRPSSWPATA